MQHHTEKRRMTQLKSSNREDDDNSILITTQEFMYFNYIKERTHMHAHDAGWSTSQQPSKPGAF